MIPYVLLILSIGLQGAAAFLALRLIPASGRRVPWIVISIALMIRFFREGVTLWLATFDRFPLNLFEEAIAMTASALFLLGVASIKPIFLQLKGTLDEREDLLEKARQARRRSDEERLLFRAVIDHMPLGVFILDRNGRMLETNGATERIWGGAAPLSQGISDYERYRGWKPGSSEALRPEEWAAARAITRGETVLDEIIEIERFDGTRGTILNSAVPIRSLDGEVTGAVVVNQDITEVRRLEMELRESEAHFRTTFENAAIGLAHLDLDRRLIRVNDRFCQITGYSREELLRRDFTEITHPQDVEEDLTLIGRLWRGDIQSYGREKRYLRKDGSSVWVHIDVSVQRDAGGRPLYNIAAVQDISDRKRLEQERESFAQMISHDLRTPLAVIQGHAEILEEGIPPGHLLTSVQAILVATDRMVHMMDDLLHMARMESGRFHLDRENLELTKFLADFFRRFRTTPEGARLHVILPPALPTVCADPTGLDRILANLLTNAFKYSEGGPVRFSACRIPGQIRFSVADRGRGIEPSELPSIFDRFYRGRSAGGTKGTGLGLYISRSLVEAHGGRIWARSRLGKGTVFFFTLPLSQTDASE